MLNSHQIYRLCKFSVNFKYTNHKKFGMFSFRGQSSEVQPSQVDLIWPSLNLHEDEEVKGLSWGRVARFDPVPERVWFLPNRWLSVCLFHGVQSSSSCSLWLFVFFFLHPNPGFLSFFSLSNFSLSFGSALAALSFFVWSSLSFSAQGSLISKLLSSSSLCDVNSHLQDF